MRIHFYNSVHPELSAAMTVAAVLMAAMLTKLGHGGWGIGVIAALCVLGSAVEPLVSARPSRRSLWDSYNVGWRSLSKTYAGSGR